jgi:hypothetical protein
MPGQHSSDRFCKKEIVNGTLRKLPAKSACQRVYDGVAAASDGLQFPGRLLSEVAGSAIQRTTLSQDYDHFGPILPAADVRLSGWNDPEEARGVVRHSSGKGGKEMCLDLDLGVFVFRQPHARTAAVHNTETGHLNTSSAAWFPNREVGGFVPHS